MKGARFLLLTVLAILIPICFSSVLPKQLIAYSFTLSLTIKSLFISILPFIIFCFIFSSMMNLNAKKAVRFVLLLLSCVFVSNLIGITVGYFIGSSVTSLIHIPLVQVQSTKDALEPVWHFIFPSIIPNTYALIAGFIFGIVCSMMQSEKIIYLSKILNKSASYVLKYFFVPILPIFILGSMFKLQYDGVLTDVLHTYGKILCVVVAAQVSYLCFLYFVASNFNIKTAWTYIKNVLPATLTGFSTSSSASSLPVLILASEKNLASETAARVIVPSVINIHTLGSALSITILCMTTISAFGMSVPDFQHFYIFGLLYAVSKFAVAGVPGGVILVIAPLIETHLHFTPDMLALITGIYVLFDPFGTAANVTGNGAFAIIFNKISKQFRSSVESEN